ncbi:MAG: hypothetical protein L0Z50_05170 [Verrucomicrobiales bacterium]|nr:hypothetical protein [Verrucomicrobiales bacterium]
MSTVTLEEAGKRLLREIVEALPREREILIRSGGKPVTTLKAVPEAAEEKPGHSLADIKPVSLGDRRRPDPHPDDDILGEMLEGKLENWKRE